MKITKRKIIEDGGEGEDTIINQYLSTFIILIIFLKSFRESLSFKNKNDNHLIGLILVNAMI